MPYTTWPPKQDPATNYTEESTCVVSKEDLCLVWAGALVLFSGANASGSPADPDGGVLQASGYNFWSGESDVEPINNSGWGHIRIPELEEVHKLFVTPKSPCIQAAVDWWAGNCSGQIASGNGGVSGNIALVHYCDTCIGTLTTQSGQYYGVCWLSGTSFASGVVDVIAFGSKY